MAHQGRGAQDRVVWSCSPVLVGMAAGDDPAASEYRAERMAGHAQTRRRGSLSRIEAGENTSTLRTAPGADDD
jgi:hypothetical protein